MNAKNHIHKAELKQDYFHHELRWYVVYGDKIQWLDLAGNPYEWDADIREAVVSQALREARESHDEATAVSQHLERLLDPQPRRKSLLERLVGVMPS